MSIQKRQEENFVTGWESPVAIHPGEFLEEYCREYHLTQADLALRADVTPKTINELVGGKSSITESMAVKLSKIFPFSVEYWLNLQAGYESDLARINQDQELQKDVRHLERFRGAYKELSRIGKVSGAKWMAKNFSAIILELQKFFSVTSLALVDDTLQVAFRKYDRKKVDSESLAAWLQLGKIKARTVEGILPFDRERLLSRLDGIKKLSTQKKEEYLPALEKMLAECGVVIVYAPCFKNTHIQAATQWVSPERAVIMINMTKKDEGKFWFNLFHEIGHLLLHSKKEFFVDIKDHDGSAPMEKQADEFSRNTLIPSFSKEIVEYMKNGSTIDLAVKEIAEKSEVSWAVVAGRMTYEFRNNIKVYPLMSKFLKERVEYFNV